MYIAPNSTVQLFTDIPLEANYINTLSWVNIGAQNTYFESKLYKTYDETTYLKSTVNYIDVEYTVDDTLMHCNYMRFKNTSFEDKWFYAFITNISYINNVTTRLTYTIDVMQTWYFDYTLNNVLVVREHPNIDNIGSNIQPESLETGEYLYRGSEKLADDYMFDYGYVVVASQSPTGDQNYNMYSSQVSLLYIKMCDNLTQLQAEINAFKSGLTSSLEPIIAIYQVPKIFLGKDGAGNYSGFGGAETELQNPQLSSFKYAYDPTGSRVGYIPRNKKLFTYPYNYMTMVLPDGTTQQYHYEYFAKGAGGVSEFKFETVGAVLPKPECMFIPMNYRGEEFCYPYALTYDGFPTIGVASDAYSAWWAQNKSSYVSGINDNIVENVFYGAHDVGSEVSLTGDYFNQREKPVFELHNNATRVNLGAMASNLMQAVTETAAEASAIFSDMKDSMFGVLDEIRAKRNHKAVPDTVVTSSTGKGLLTSLERTTAIIYYTQISAEYAEVIDNFFTRYGYATNQLKTPDIRSRPHWNYIKTASCTISTNIPAEFEDAICKIYDNGITFWHSPNMVGNYSADNSP